MVSDEPIQERILRVEFKLTHLVAEAEQEVVGDAAVDVHQDYDRPD